VTLTLLKRYSKVSCIPVLTLCSRSSRSSDGARAIRSRSSASRPRTALRAPGNVGSAESEPGSHISNMRCSFAYQAVIASGSLLRLGIVALQSC
jgi:hypothetical protein